MWRIQARSELSISDQKTVYCYNGSAKSWQCPEDTVDFFIIEYKKNNNAFLLILTQDIEIFENILTRKNLPKNSYIIKKVTHKEIYKYLSAADYGLIFRENNILNWVSRPTKALEYEAVGIKIIHNNTVDFLLKKYPN